MIKKCLAKKIEPEQEKLYNLCVTKLEMTNSAFSAKKKTNKIIIEKQEEQRNNVVNVEI